MRPSLNDIKQQEQYLTGAMTHPDAALFEARLLTDARLKADTRLLEKALSLVRLYNRKRLKDEAATVHDQLFNDPARQAFQQNIRRLFKQ